MQILLGVNETIIKINSKSLKIDYIQHFVSTHFTDRVISGNSIFIPQSANNQYHRTFLLKWLYSLYTKKSKNNFLELREILIKRQHKAIKILLYEDIIHRISYKIVNQETIDISISPANNQIAYKIKTFLNTKIRVLPTSLSVTIKTQEDKRLFKEFINSKNIIDVPHLHIYHKEEMKNFLLKKEYRKKIINHIDKAYIILGLNKNYNVQTLKKRYKKLAMQYHPDKADIKDDKTIIFYTQKFQTILQAYEILLERSSAVNYDNLTSQP